MILALTILLVVIGAFLAFAAWLKVSRGLSFRKAFFFAPLKLLYRVDDSAMVQARNAAAPAIYVISHQSRLDPALMLALLPDDTLHILDDESAKSAWLEPWRELATTITFNAEHLFISRRLVRRLKGRARLAVYLPPIADNPSKGELSLYRAVARIAVRGDADVIAIHAHGHRKGVPQTVRADAVHFGLFPALAIIALPPIKLPPLVTSSTSGQTRPSEALLQRVRQAADLKAAG